MQYLTAYNRTFLQDVLLLLVNNMLSFMHIYMYILKLFCPLDALPTLLLLQIHCDQQKSAFLNRKKDTKKIKIDFDIIEYEKTNITQMIP